MYPAIKEEVQDESCTVASLRKVEQFEFAINLFLSIFLIDVIQNVLELPIQVNSIAFQSTKGFKKSEMRQGSL